MEKTSIKNNIALLGFGVVGKAFFDIIKNNKYDGEKVNVKYIYVREGKSDKYNKDYNTDIFTSDIDKILNSDVNTIVECAVYNDEIYKFTKDTLLKGKKLITSNKKLIGLNYKEFNDICKKTGAKLYYEASALGGVNIFHNIFELQKCDKIISFDGIVNGTTNYMLSKMDEENLDFDTVLKEAQKLGFAEADPSSDIDGVDAQYKLSILNIFINKKFVSFSDIPASGIRYIKKEDIEYAKKNNKVIKLIGHIEDDVVYCMPTLLNKDTFMAYINKNLNFATINSVNLGVSTYVGAGAGGDPTAKSLLMDVQSMINDYIDYNVDTTDMSINGNKEFLFYINDNGKVTHEKLSIKDVMNRKKENVFIMRED